MSYASGSTLFDLASEEMVAAPLSGAVHLPWYAIRVRPRWERVAADALLAKQYEPFLPLYKKANRWSDRTKIVNVPLFPGYVFCRSDLSGRQPLLTTPGVIGILKFGDTPAIIEHTEIESLKAVLHSNLFAGPWPYLAAGQRVRIHSGALTGVEGILLHLKNEYRVVLSVAALCRSVAVEVDRNSVLPLHSMAA